MKWNKFWFIALFLIIFIVSTRLTFFTDEVYPDLRLVQLGSLDSGNLGPSHQQRAEFLFKTGDASDKEIGRQVLHDVAIYSYKYYHSVTPGSDDYTDQFVLQLDTVNILMDLGDEEDKRVGMKAISNALESARHSLSFGKEEKPQRILLLIATHENPLKLEALEILLRCGNEEYKRMAWDVKMSQLVDSAKAGQHQAVRELCDIARNNRPTYVSYGPETGTVVFGGAHLMSESMRFCDKKYFAALEGLKYIVQQISHPNRYEAAKFLYDQGERKEGEKALREISLQANHPNQKEAGKTLSWGCMVM